MSLSRTVTFSSVGLDRRTINGELRGARNVTMLSLIGNPRGNYNQECRSPTNQNILSITIKDDVGPFAVSGLKPAVSSLKTIFGEIKRDKRHVYDALGTAGMLCCRYVRGSHSAISNHSWGTAIDLKLEGKVDTRGDNRTQVGLLEIYEIFQKHGFFWGAGFTREDSMHFEASEQLVRKWAQDGQLVATNGTEITTYITFGDRGTMVESLQEKLNLILGLDLDVDGIFGPATRAAVIEFQKFEGLSIDGVVGPETKEKLGL